MGTRVPARTGGTTSGAATPSTMPLIGVVVADPVEVSCRRKPITPDFLVWWSVVGGLPVPRPVHANAAATRERILKAARKLFIVHGVSATTLRQIAKKAGVTMATIHHYFGSKDGLYRACLDAMVESQQRQYAQLSRVIAEASSRDDAIDQAVRASYQIARNNRENLWLLMRAITSDGTPEREVRDRWLLPFLEQGTALVAPLLGKSLRETRLALLSVNYLIARYALNGPRELALAIGGDLDGRAAQRVAEDYLVAAARALLGL